MKEIPELLEPRHERPIIKTGSKRLEDIEKNAESGIYPDETPMYGLLAFILYLTATGRTNEDGYNHEVKQNYADLLEQFTSITTPYLIMRARKSLPVEIYYLPDIVPSVNSTDMYVINVVEILIADVRNNDPAAANVAHKVMKLLFKEKYKHASKYSTVTIDTVIKDFLEGTEPDSLTSYKILTLSVYIFCCKINRARFSPSFYTIYPLIEDVWEETKKSTYRQFANLHNPPPSSFMDKYFSDCGTDKRVSNSVYDLFYCFNVLLRDAFSMASEKDESFAIRNLLPNACYKAHVFKDLTKDETDLVIKFFGGAIDALKATIYRSSLVDMSVMLSLLNAMGKSTEEIAAAITPAVKGEAKAEKAAEAETVEALKAQLFEERSKTETQRALLEESRKECEELKKKAADTDDMSYELNALRKYVYEQSSEAPVTETVSTEKMAEAIRSGKIVIIGGHDNWTNKLKDLFPKWTYLKPSATGSVPTNVIDSAEWIYFFSDHICHPQYNRFLDAARIRNITVGYIAKVNIEANIRQIYADYSGKAR